MAAAGGRRPRLATAAGFSGSGSGGAASSRLQPLLLLAGPTHTHTASALRQCRRGWCMQEQHQQTCHPLLMPVYSEGRATSSGL